jgi:hypothetical protein
MKKQKVLDSTKPLGERYYIGGSKKRLFVNVECPRCREVRTVRWDDLRNRIKKYGDYSYLCMSCKRIKENGHSNKLGYVIRHYKTFPPEYWDILSSMCKSNGQIKEHRAVMAISLNRPLESDEVVHHINGIRDDNRVENLEIFKPSNTYNKSHCRGIRESEVVKDNRRLVEENEALKKKISELEKEMMHACRKG